MTNESGKLIRKVCSAETGSVVASVSLYPDGFIHVYFCGYKRRSDTKFSALVVNAKDLPEDDFIRSCAAAAAAIAI